MIWRVVCGYVQACNWFEVECGYAYAYMHISAYARLIVINTLDWIEWTMNFNILNCILFN